MHGIFPLLHGGRGHPGGRVIDRFRPLSPLRLMFAKQSGALKTIVRFVTRNRNAALFCLLFHRGGRAPRADAGDRARRAPHLLHLAPDAFPPPKDEERMGLVGSKKSDSSNFFAAASMTREAPIKGAVNLQDDEEEEEEDDVEEGERASRMRRERDRILTETPRRRRLHSGEGVVGQYAASVLFSAAASSVEQSPLGVSPLGWKMNERGMKIDDEESEWNAPTEEGNLGEDDSPTPVNFARQNGAKNAARCPRRARSAPALTP